MSFKNNKQNLGQEETPNLAQQWFESPSKTKGQIQPNIITGSQEKNVKQVQTSSSFQTKHQQHEDQHHPSFQGCSLIKPNEWNDLQTCPPQFSHLGHHHGHVSGSSHPTGFRQ